MEYICGDNKVESSDLSLVNALLVGAFIWCVWPDKW